ncbi:hypothetical protein GCM10028857_21110 [Salinarchaeum chitinilyticum]
MPPTRRTALAAIGAGVSSQLLPATATAVQDGNSSSVGGQEQSDDSTDGDELVLEWTATESGELDWSCTDAVRAPDDGFVAVCNLLDERVFGPATKLIHVGVDGAVSEIATIGDPSDASTAHWTQTIAADGDGGYVIGGMELELENGELAGSDHPLRHVSSDGTVDWTVPSPSPGDVTFPRIVEVAPDDEGYVVAVGERISGLAAGLVAYDESGEERWRAGFDGTFTPGVEPMDLVPVDGGVVFLGIRGTSQNTTKPPKPVLARTNVEGITTGPTIPVVDGGRYPRSVSQLDDQILVTGELTDQQGSPTGEGWAMGLSEVGAKPSWRSTYPSVTRIYTGTRAVGSKVPIFAGANDSSGVLRSGESLQKLSTSQQFDQFTSTQRLFALSDGSVHLIGTAGDDDSALFLARISTPIDAAELQTDVSSTTVTPEETVEFSVADSGAYDQSLLETEWSVDGSVVTTGGSGTTTFAETGEHVLTATVQTTDGRTASVERTITVEAPASDGSGDGSPGFGVLAAGSGLAGAAMLHRLRGGNSDGDTA